MWGFGVLYRKSMEFLYNNVLVRGTGVNQISLGEFMPRDPRFLGYHLFHLHLHSGLINKRLPCEDVLSFTLGFFFFSNQ